MFAIFVRTEGQMHLWLGGTRNCDNDFDVVFQKNAKKIKCVKKNLKTISRIFRKLVKKSKIS
jgi:hypothetical protein